MYGLIYACTYELYVLHVLYACILCTGCMRVDTVESEQATSPSPAHVSGRVKLLIQTPMTL